MQAISSRVPTDAESTDIDVLGWMSRAALELIGQAGIGYSFDPLVENVPDAYAEAAKYLACVLSLRSAFVIRIAEDCTHVYRVTITSPEMILLRQVAPFLERLGPVWLSRWVMKNSPVRNVRRIVQIGDVLHERSLEIFQAKRAAIEAGDDTDSKDIMSILCMCRFSLFHLLACHNCTVRANMAASGEDRLPEDQLLGQMSCVSPKALRGSVRMQMITMFPGPLSSRQWTPRQTPWRVRYSCSQNIHKCRRNCGARSSTRRRMATNWITINCMLYRT